MNAVEIDVLISNLLVVLVAGFLAGLVCKRLGVSLLVGYLVVGGVIGEGGLRLVGRASHELEYLAEAGALLLLFAIGIEFSLGELLRLSRYATIGGATQMLLVAMPLLVVCRQFGMSWNAAVLSSAAAALSSTVLVFKVLAEYGETASAHGRRGIAILLFQDVALVPLMLLVPLLTGEGEAPSIRGYTILALKSIVFIASVALLRQVIGRLVVPMLAARRSVELVVLFALVVLGGACWASYRVGLPPAIGALAAGLMLSDNRLSKQIDTILLPFRESFAAVFFVTLGMLLDPMDFFRAPWLLTGGLLGMLLLKSLAATLALRLTGLAWVAAVGMGLGLAQLGEFSFLLISQGLRQGVIDAETYRRMLFIALGTLIVTPMLLRVGLGWAGRLVDGDEEKEVFAWIGEPVRRGVIVGAGPIGRQLASQLETLGVDVWLIDLSPINLHSFAQHGFHTVAGDARERDVLERALVADARLVVVSVPDDEVALQIVRSVRELASGASILVRCRYQLNIGKLMAAGASAVVSEEAQASGALLDKCTRLVSQGQDVATRRP